MSNQLGQAMISEKTVLVVDDDPDVVLGVSARLRNAGYRTITESDGASGIATATAAQPDAIVMDLRLPRKDGLSALAELRQSDETKHIPIVMLSACLREQQRALDAGARYFLPKPYQGSILVKAIDSAVDKAESE